MLCRQIILHKPLPRRKQTQKTQHLGSRDNKVSNETKLVHEGLQMLSHHFPTK